MEPSAKQPVNKDLILREKLAIERTIMANDRTLLSFIRTALYFVIAGLTLNQLVDIRYGTAISFFALLIGALLLVVGFARYFKQARKIRESRMHIGNYLLHRDVD